MSNVRDPNTETENSSKMTVPVLGVPVSIDLIKIARTRIAQAYRQNPITPEEIERFKTHYLDWHIASKLDDAVIPASAKTESVRLTRHKLKLNPEQNDTANEVAIVIIDGYYHHYARALPRMMSLMTKLKEEAARRGESVNYACYIQGFRGNEEKKQAFYKYSIAQHVRDQQVLIKELVEKGKRVIIVGNSFGSNVGLWAVYDLIAENPEKAPLYSSILYLSANGLGDPLLTKEIQDYFKKPELVAQARQILENHEILHKRINKEETLHFSDMAKLLKHIIMQRVHGDKTIEVKASLVDKFKDDGVMRGNVFDVYSSTMKSDEDPHYEKLENLHLEGMSGVTSLHVWTAAIAGKPITFDCGKVEPLMHDGSTITKYYLTLHDKNDVILLPDALNPNIKTPSDLDAYVIGLNPYAEFVAKIHKYCITKAISAQQEGKEHSSLFSSHTNEENIRSAVTIIAELIKAVASALMTNAEPDLTFFNQLEALKKGAHKNGDLGAIFKDLCKALKKDEFDKRMRAANELKAKYEKMLEPLNAWIMQMNADVKEVFTQTAKTVNDDVKVSSVPVTFLSRRPSQPDVVATVEPQKLALR